MILVNLCCSLYECLFLIMIICYDDHVVLIFDHDCCVRWSYSVGFLIMTVDVDDRVVLVLIITVDFDVRRSFSVGLWWSYLNPVFVFKTISFPFSFSPGLRTDPAWSSFSASLINPNWRLLPVVSPWIVVLRAIRWRSLSPRMSSKTRRTIWLPSRSSPPSSSSRWSSDASSPARNIAAFVILAGVLAPIGSADFSAGRCPYILLIFQIGCSWYGRTFIFWWIFGISWTVSVY